MCAAAKDADAQEIPGETCLVMAEIHHHLETATAVDGVFTLRAQRRESAKVLVDRNIWASSSKEY